MCGEYVWRCRECDVTWVGDEAGCCWSCGEYPSHVKPYRPSLIVGSANMGRSG